MGKALGAVALVILWLSAVGGALAAEPPLDRPQRIPEPGQPIIVRWSTESEVNTAGYNVYRASSEAGPWQKINDRLIPGSPDPLRGGRYVFTDTNVLAGQTYWYELEEIELNGTSTRLQRTQATARARLAGPLSGGVCGATLLPAAGTALIVAQRMARRRPGRRLIARFASLHR